ncbi:MAG TPA: 30S ribosomal protein S8 [Gammaproteobacteria bacterium]|nr:30S ribosomal protein S8 [Gammaproteobacteria bacterium]
MSVTDPIADMLTRIRNASIARHPQAAMPYSKLREAIAKILKEEGFIQNYEVLPGKVSSSLLLHLKYTRGRRAQPVINGLNRISKPGRRAYVGKQDIPWVRSGLGIAILSTSKGVMTGAQARRQGLGGEVLCYVW